MINPLYFQRILLTPKLFPFMRIQGRFRFLSLVLSLQVGAWCASNLRMLLVMKILCEMYILLLAPCPMEELSSLHASLYLQCFS